jgi:hypothetical protein
MRLHCQTHLRHAALTHGSGCKVGPGVAMGAMTPLKHVRGQKRRLDSVPETGRLLYGRHNGIAETATLVQPGYVKNCDARRRRNPAGI